MDNQPSNPRSILTDFIQDIFNKAYNNTWNWFKEEIKEHDFFKTAAKKYGKKIYDRYNTIRVFGMNRPVPLKDLFVRVNILEKITARQRISLQDLEQYFDRDRRAFGKEVETKSGIEVVNTFQKFIVLGKPGAGKSTYLKYLALQSVEKDSAIKDRKIPIFISLKELADSDQTLFDFILYQFDICDLPDAGPFITQILKNGKCLVLLDGLDEVQEERKNTIIQQIIDFSDKFSDNQVVISCRIAAYNHWFQQFTDLCNR